MSAPPLKFLSSKLHTEPVEIDGTQFLLKEASGAAVAQFRNHTISKARMRDGEVVGIDGGVADAESLLVSLCLYQLQDGKEVAAVPLASVRAWPSRITSALFKRIKEVSGMDEDAATPEKLKAEMEKLKRQLERLEGDDPNR